MIESLKIQVVRFAFKPNYTIGRLFFNDVYFSNTLEDTVRILGPNGEGKIYGKTAIPSGEYEFNLVFWPKFNIWTPRLLKVPFFEGVRVHSGVTDQDTEGCILVGKNTIVGKLTESRNTFNEMMTRFEKGKTYKIEIIEKR